MGRATCPSCHGSGSYLTTESRRNPGMDGPTHIGVSVRKACLHCGGGGTIGVPDPPRAIAPAPPRGPRDTATAPPAAPRSPSFEMPRVERYSGGRLFLLIRHGQGSARHAGGWQYEGRWSLGKWSGEGTLTCPDRWTYQGRFSGGRPHGEGKLVLADGRSYVGRFRAGFPTGKGVLELGGDARFVGRWNRDGKANGKYESGGKRNRAQIREGRIIVWRGLFGKEDKGAFDARRIYGLS